ELRLNRRLAPDIYIAVAPLMQEPGGNLAIGGEGVVIDWLVKMVRLSAERMLDRRLARGDWHFADTHALADCLARFFGAARHVYVQPTAYLGRFRAECRATNRAFDASGGLALRQAASCVIRYIDAFIGRHRDLLVQRLADFR